jgi:hypothetical protein
MKPKYALSQGIVKKKKHKKALNPQKKISCRSDNSKTRGIGGIVEPCF